MRYLVSVPPEKIIPATKEEWAPFGEPVIPDFPTSGENVFLSTVSFKKSMAARVVVDPSIDIDDIATGLKKEYPGLPKHLLEIYVLKTAEAAHTFELNANFRIFITKDSAKLQVIGTEIFFELWNKQPIMK